MLVRVRTYRTVMKRPMTSVKYLDLILGTVKGKGPGAPGGRLFQSKK